MEVKIGEILEFAAVDDKTVSAFGQMELLNQALGRGVDICQKIGVYYRVEVAQGGDWLFRHKQNMQRVSWLWVVERQQRGSFT